MEKNSQGWIIVIPEFPCKPFPLPGAGKATGGSKAAEMAI